MQYFKDTAKENAPYEFEDNVTPIEAQDGSYTFEVHKIVHVPDVIVHHPAETVHHDAVLGIDPNTGNPVIVKDAYDEVIKDTYDEVTVPAHDETVTVLALSDLPKTLVPITQTEFQALEAANQSAIPVLPNIQEFINDVKSGVGGIVAANSLAIAYPLFFAAIQEQNWPDVQALILDAHSKNVINQTQYTAMKAAAASNNIPLTLP